MDMEKLTGLCIKYYPKKKLHHALRVAGYAADMAKYRKDIKTIDAYAVGLAHDLIEDTECDQNELMYAIGTDLFTSVLLLTKEDNVEYKDYVLNIVYSDDELAKLVKRADMKDHMMQTETLTDKLKEKYIPVLGYLM